MHILTQHKNDQNKKAVTRTPLFWAFNIARKRDFQFASFRRILRGSQLQRYLRVVNCKKYAYAFVQKEMLFYCLYAGEQQASLLTVTSSSSPSPSWQIVATSINIKIMVAGRCSLSLLNYPDNRVITIGKNGKMVNVKMTTEWRKFNRCMCKYLKQLNGRNGFR